MLNIRLLIREKHRANQLSMVLAQLQLHMRTGTEKTETLFLILAFLLIPED